MGLYDSFYGKLICPSCKKDNGTQDKNSKFNGLAEMQTKQLDCFCNCYFKGDLVSEMFKYVEVYISCNHCDYWIEAKALLNNKGEFTGKFKTPPNRSSTKSEEKE